MVKVKENAAVSPKEGGDANQWMKHLEEKHRYKDLSLIKNACSLTQLVGEEQATQTGESCFVRGLLMADVLVDLEVDQETISAAIVYETYRFAELSIEDISEQLGSSVAKLVLGVAKMSGLSNLTALKHYSESKHQVDNIRKMLLAMVDDVRVVLIKLAERLCVLRTSAPLPEEMRKEVANEAMQIYAPLANRLGIGAIKWELEDLAFRYLQSDAYMEIAKGLKAKRIERDKFVKGIVAELNQQMSEMGYAHYSVYGRAKHIHSIYRKMNRKNIPLEEIYDATAVRILVDTETQCYEILSLVHALWKQVVIEFDDYISNPKPNGYQSLHTAVENRDGRVFEVQIRTFEMHDLAEMGVAAHWKYKEGDTSKKESHERKIEWLREVLAWHHEMAVNQGVSEVIETEFLEDRVYVFTPNDDVIDLPQGATPLDFAYHVHSEVGHRCRGAKIDGHIVPLTHTLKTGEKVEILTGKEAKPSRDWINPHLNYLKSSRAKAKVSHWFNMQAYDDNRAEGQELLDKELKMLGIKAPERLKVAKLLNFKTVDDMHAAIGRGDLKLLQVVHKFSPADSREDPESLLEEVIKHKPAPHHDSAKSDLKIEGVGNLLTHMARCCQPVPGDDVIGYITLGKGVSVHRQDCPNILHASEKGKKRLIEVSWGSDSSERYVVDVVVKAYDRTGLLKDLTSLLSNEKVNVFALQTNTNRDENISYFSLSIEIGGLNSLSKLLSKLGQIPNVIEARRQV